MSKLIIVSNRLPVSVKKTDGKLEYSSSIGGLATALASFTRGGNSLWIGWPGLPAEDLTESDRAQIEQELRKHNCHPVYLTRAQIDKFYNGYSNSVLWPLFHHLAVETGDTAANWKAYQEVNRIFAEETVRLSKASDTVWVHDYQLLLTPEMIRVQRPTQRIGFFLHIPFPAPEHLFKTSHAPALLRGTLGADLVGLHTPSYAEKFLESCAQAKIGQIGPRKVALSTRIVRVTDFPISIDYEKFAKATKTQAVAIEYKKLQWKYRGRKVILMSDRMDPTKGLVQRLTAYQTLLRTHPELHKKVVLAMIAMPSRGEIEVYKNLRSSIEQLVTEINDEFGVSNWQPVDAIFNPVPFAEYAALYRRADVAFIAPIRDGMNLVAKEFLASATKHDGVLVLSETAGAAEELKDAVLVNPAKPLTLVKGLYTALTMPRSELRRRTANMQRHIKHFNVNRWVESFMTTLERPVSAGPKLILTRTLGPKQQQMLLNEYAHARKRLIMLDYDGTLTPIVRRPEEAVPSKKTIDLLRQLANDPANEVVVVSGREKKELQEWFGDLPLALAAEHGALFRRKGGHNWHHTASDHTAWHDEIGMILDYYAEKTPGAEVEHKEATLVWHYRNASPYYAQKYLVAIRQLVKPLVKKYDLIIKEGKKVLEIQPQEVHKGRIAQEWLIHDHDFVIAIGDDTTDEDMFTAIPPDSWSIKVGRGPTSANYRLPNVDAVYQLLHKTNTKTRVKN